MPAICSGKTEGQKGGGVGCSISAYVHKAFLIAEYILCEYKLMLWKIGKIFGKKVTGSKK